MNIIIFLAVYLAFGFIFMTTCAKFGWMGKYDPALMYWIAWPVVIFGICVSIIVRTISYVSEAVQNYVDGLKPNQTENG